MVVEEDMYEGGEEDEDSKQNYRSGNYADEIEKNPLEMEDLSSDEEIDIDKKRD